jgi:hypothetical protein
VLRIRLTVEVDVENEIEEAIENVAAGQDISRPA